MVDITSVADLRPLVGSSAFVPAILSYIRNSSSGNLPLDPVIFQAILLCLVAGDKHLILLTPEEDIGLVVKLAVWTLSSIFDLPTQKVKIRSRVTSTVRAMDILPSRDPGLFLRSLFMSRSDTADQCRPTSQSRNRSGKRRPSNLRSTSFPNDLSVFGNPNLSLAEGIVKQELAISRPDIANPLLIAAPQPRPFTHAHTEPIPVRRSLERPEFPHALVLSGVEHASVSEQTTFANVLADRQVVLEPRKPPPNDNAPRQRRTASHNSRNREGDHQHGSDTFFDDSEFDGTWNVPEGFITICVCPWDSRERPKIHRSLLDQFAMSSTVFVQTHIRHALRALPFTSNPGHTRLHNYTQSNPPTPSPLHTPALPQPRTPSPLTRNIPGVHHHLNRSNSYTQPPTVPKQLLPRDFLLFLHSAAQRTHVSAHLSLYLSDLFSAVRHHSKLDGTFLTVKSMNDAKALARVGRVLGTDPTGGELIRDYHGTEYLDDEAIENNDDPSHGTFGHYDDIASGSGSITLNVPRELSPAPSRTSIKESEVNSTVEALYVSEAAIARIVPRVVTHRLRVRDGPQDEILAGAIFGATFEPPDRDLGDTVLNSYRWDTRSTVKDILIEILAEV